MKKTFIKARKFISSAFLSLAISVPAIAGPFEPVKSKLDLFAAGLLTLSLPITIIAILVLAWKLMYDGRTIHECKNLIIGAVLAGSASAFAAAILAS